MKKYLSGNRITKNNDNSKRININIKVNNYNKENNDNNNNDDKQYNDNNNNNNERKKYNIQINNDKKDKNNKNDQQKIVYKKYDDNKNKRNDINNKKEENNKNEIKEELDNEKKKEPEYNVDQANYTHITINSNNYKNIRILGQGSYGKIYLVEDLKTKEQYAMKKLILGDKLELRDNQDEYNMIMQITTSYAELNIIYKRSQKINGSKINYRSSQKKCLKI